MRGVAWVLLGIFGGSTVLLIVVYFHDELQWRRLERKVRR